VPSRLGPHREHSFPSIVTLFLFPELLPGNALIKSVTVSSFMEIGTGVQAILKSCFSNLKVYNVGINDRFYMLRRSNGLISYGMNTKFHDDWIKHSSNITTVTTKI
jgi:hypothetical protein